jgi:type II secretory ATPase GspE/PulE/Tfp pilus assembly ATPase PilB-like protein/CRP-like cAMP-binding protein
MNTINSALRQDIVAQEILQGSVVFGQLSEVDQLWCAERVQITDVAAGEVVIAHGDAATGIYLIAKGRARILTERQGDGKVILDTYGPGESFGERSVLLHCPVSATVLAAEDLVLLRIGVADALELVGRSPSLELALRRQIERDAEYNFLRTLSLLAGLRRQDIEELMRSAARISLAAGDYLFREGDPGDAAYLVRSGKIQIVKESAGNAEINLLEYGGLFGEMALNTGAARNAGARAVEDSIVLRLRRAEYDRIRSSAEAEEVIRRQAAQRWSVLDSLLYRPDTPEGRTKLLNLLHGVGGVERYWQRIKQEKQLPEQALEVLSRATGLGYLTPSTHLLVDPEVVRQVPSHYAQANQVLPVFHEGDRVEVLVTTPYLGTIPGELQRLFGVPISLRLTEPQFLAKLIETSTADGESIAGSLTDLDTGDAWEELDSIEDLKDQAQAAPIIKLVNNIFMEAISKKASDIHIEPYEEGLEVRLRIDGVLQVVSTAPRRYQAAIVSRIKIMANLDIAERRIPQDGRISLRIEAKNFDIRVATVPTVFGEGSVMRILDKSSVQIRIEDIGFAAEMLEQWKWAVDRPNGVVLVTGPTGSGKTTTLYATLNHVKSPEVKIITAEDPVEYQLHGIKQIQVDNKVNLTFAAALRSMLRLDPDIIMVGEMRDHETAEIGIQAALTGHLVFSTLHTNDAATAVTRLVEMGIAPYLVASSVVAILAQRLVRKLCGNCRRQVGQGAWEASGCSQCEGSGYKGRIGIYELLLVDETIRDLIAQSKDAAAIGVAARERGFITMAADGQAKVALGLTSMEEVRREAG